MTWFIFAFLSAFFASLTTIFAKIGVGGINTDFATAIRSIIVLIFAWAIVAVKADNQSFNGITKTGLIFTILSGIATVLSWLFYFYALDKGTASKVSPIDKLSLVLTIVFASVFLKEKITLPIAAGAILMSLGATLIALAK